PGPSAPLPQAPAELFFIAGSYRSGTTWVQGMLHAHPEVFVLDEGWFLNDRGASVEAWLDTEAFGRWAGLEHNGWLRAIPRAEAELIARRAMMEALMREAAARAQRRTRITRIGDKTTFYYNDRPEALHALFPRSRYIRDRKSVV